MNLGTKPVHSTLKSEIQAKSASTEAPAKAASSGPELPAKAASKASSKAASTVPAKAASTVPAKAASSKASSKAASSESGPVPPVKAKNKKSVLVLEREPDINVDTNIESEDNSKYTNLLDNKDIKTKLKPFEVIGIDNNEKKIKLIKFIENQTKTGDDLKIDFCKEFNADEEKNCLRKIFPFRLYELKKTISVLSESSGKRRVLKKVAALLKNKKGFKKHPMNNQPNTNRPTKKHRRSKRKGRGGQKRKLKNNLNCNFFKLFFSIY